METRLKEIIGHMCQGQQAEIEALEVAIHNVAVTGW
jgi:hypothetical protein